MKNQVCPKPDCMYLHEIGNCRHRAEELSDLTKGSLMFTLIAGDEAASFTKEEMQQGKHTDYERQLHEQLITTHHNHKEPR